VTEPVLSVGWKKSKDKPIPPYVLGGLLGDGSLTDCGIRLTTCDHEIADRMIELCPGEIKGPYFSADPSHRAATYSFSPRGKTAVQLRKLGLMGHDSYSKFIPQMYLRGKLEERWELLRGLMDTDGWCEQDGDAHFCTTSAALRRDVAELARSLGAVVS